MSTERKERANPTAMRETIAGMNSVFGEVFGPKISVGTIELVDQSQIRNLNANQFGEQYSVVSVVGNIGMPGNAFVAESPAHSTFRSGTLKMKIRHELGNPLFHLHAKDQMSRLSASNSSNSTFIYTTMELLKHLAQKSALDEEYKAVQGDSLIEEVRKELAEKFHDFPERSLKLSEYLVQAKAGTTFRTHGMGLEMLINKRPFIKLFQDLDLQMRRYVAGNLFPYFAMHMMKNSRWYLPPENPYGYVPSAEENPEWLNIAHFLKRNNYLEGSVKDGMKEYIQGNMGRRMQSESVRSKVGQNQPQEQVSSELNQIPSYILKGMKGQKVHLPNETNQSESEQPIESTATQLVAGDEHLLDDVSNDSFAYFLAYEHLNEESEYRTKRGSKARKSIQRGSVFDE